MAWGGLAAGAVGFRTVREVQQEAAADGFLGSEVVVGGVVTWVAAEEERFFYVEDATGGIRVVFRDGGWPRLGDQVVVRGRLERGEFAPSVVEAGYVSVRRVDREVLLPKAKGASGGGLLNGAYSCERVLVDGWVRRAELEAGGTLQAVLNSGGARITVRIRGYEGPRAEDLIAAKVSVTGVATPVKARGGTRQLVDVRVLAAEGAGMRIHSREARNPWQDPVMSLAKAFSYRPGQTRGDRIHLYGQVIHRSGETVFLNDGTAGLAVRGAGAVQFARGDWVEAVGFMDLESFLPVVSDAVVLSAAAGPEAIVAERRTFDSLLDGLMHSGYVEIEGELIDRMRTPGEGGGSTVVLALRTADGVFAAELEAAGGDGLVMAYELGCTLAVAGICQVSTDAEGSPTGFKVLVPDGGAIRQVKAEGFFTVRRLWVMLTVALGVLLVCMLYAYFSTRRNLRLLAEIGERRAVSAERNRMARDLHDTLEQGLTGIHLQLHSIGPALEEASEETQRRLESIRELVRQCHAEMRQSILGLRSAATGDFDLGDALKRIADTLVAGSGIRVELRQRRQGVRIPPLIEDNLLRIGQEALTNAVKHAGAGRIVIDLVAEGGKVVLEVSDDGAGGVPQRKPGHFGLVGMEERAARIGAQLTLVANPGGGCSVRVEVELKQKIVFN